MDPLGVQLHYWLSTELGGQRMLRLVIGIRSNLLPVLRKPV
jgi:hypothetical protein